jgi:hypothetical protein
MIGIEYTLKDGSKESYDPIRIDDISETDTHYVLNMIYRYEIPKNDVLSFRYYVLCNICKRDICECDEMI